MARTDVCRASRSGSMVSRTGILPAGPGDTGYFGVTDGVLENTLDASVWRNLYLTESDADHDLRFDYVRYSALGAAVCILRYTDSNNQLYVEINPTVIHLRQRDGGVLTTLDSISTTVAQDTWYSLRAVVDGADVSVLWGEKGGDSSEILSTNSATELTTARASYFRVSPNSEHGWDNIQLIADGRSTTQTFTYNDANEQLTSTVNGVTTDMVYDEWGRLEERDDGTHTATYAYRYGSKLYSVTSDFPGEGNVTYEYGGDQKRRSRVAGAQETWYNYTVGFDVVSTEDAANGSTGALTMTNVVRSPTDEVSATLGDLAGATPATGTARYYATDHLGSTRSAWDVSKVAVGFYEFTPYGREFSHSGERLTSLVGTYTGTPWDGTARLFHFPYRQYSPDLARWTTRDPLGMVDGPNQYGYVTGNSVNMVDPTGTSIIGDIETAAGLAIGCALCIKAIGVSWLKLAACAILCKKAAIECKEVLDDIADEVPPLDAPWGWPPILYPPSDYTPTPPIIMG